MAMAKPPSEFVSILELISMHDGYMTGSTMDQQKEKKRACALH